MYRESSASPQARPSARRRRATRALVAGYIHEVSDRHGNGEARRAAAEAGVPVDFAARRSSSSRSE
jgi:hypothetical protein